jgi:EmrB/QacA subfamily drug resistance transporter
MGKKWWTLVVVCAATLMLLLDITIVTVALPEIQRGLGASFSDLQWVVDAYSLTLASVLLTSGSLADRYGRRLLFSGGLAIFTLGSLLCGVAQSPLMLVLSRAFQGIGGAILFSTSLALLAQSFQGKERGLAFGVWGAITGVATSLGPILGGAITSGISWRGIFLVNLPIGVAALAVTLWRVEESRLREASRPDWPGFASLTVGLVSLVYGLIRAGEISWSDTGAIACLCIAGAVFVAFVVIERRARHPMFDLSLFRVPTFVGGSVAAFCMNGSLFAMFVYIVLYLQYDLGYSALGTGLRLVILSGSLLVAATLAGRASSYVPLRRLIGPGLLLVGAGLLLMSGLDGTSSWTNFVPGFIVGGIGSGLVNPPLASTAVGVVAPQRSGMASGVNTTFRQIGIATSIAALGTIFASTFRSNLDHALAPVAGLSGRGAEVATAVQRGQVGPVFRAAAPEVRGQLAGAIHSSFASSMNDLFVVAAVVAFVGALASLALIRGRDFVAPQAAGLGDPQARRRAAVSPAGSEGGAGGDLDVPTRAVARDPSHG